MNSDVTEIIDLDANSDLKLRDRYLLERERIKSQIGDLDQILLSLGVNQRRACQLLLVDPSAWTRWNKTEAPPHIYQALKWLVMLKKTNPGLVGTTDLETRIDTVQSSTQTKIRELEQVVASLERALAIQPVTTHSTDESVLVALFRAQEDRLQKRVSELEEKIRQLKTSPRQTKRKAKVSPKKAKSKKKRRPRKKTNPKVKRKPVLRKKKKVVAKKKIKKIKRTKHR